MKLFSSILASTIWREANHVRIVWITLLAMSDRHGLVECSIPGLADLARVTVDECRNAIDVLSSPDPDSRTKTNEGRRIEAVDGVGFLIINYETHRQKMSAEERREYKARKAREYRARAQEASRQTRRQQIPQMDKVDTYADADANANTEYKEKEKEKEKKGRFQKPTPDEVTAYAKTLRYDLDGQRFCDHYDSVGWKIGGKSPMKDWKAAVRTWLARDPDAQRKAEMAKWREEHPDEVKEMEEYGFKFSD